MDRSGLQDNQTATQEAQRAPGKGAESSGTPRRVKIATSLLWDLSRFLALLPRFSTDSKLAAEFRVTRSLSSGANVLAMEVSAWSAASYLEGQDMWRLSGITRDVYLYARHLGATYETSRSAPRPRVTSTSRWT
ncbi:unnamed protein product [Prorocentrum cordatum]|uniref:beta-galactosidase n=1 Tax=Prorocentrum cordatum TaxID=2364126 RepID=A0ABN9PFE8_9DINO|nr:unnamed protein product [Polarella glacialis]